MSLSKLTVWYNTRCPVCDRGIRWQNRRLMRSVKAGDIEFRDINLEPDALAGFGADLEAIRKRLHGLDAAGALFVGADCVIEIWRRTPGDAWLAAIVGLPVVRGVASFGYDRFASVLYRWNRRRGHW